MLSNGVMTVLREGKGGSAVRRDQLTEEQNVGTYLMPPADVFGVALYNSTAAWLTTASLYR